MPDDAAVFYQRRTIMARHALYGVILLAIMGALVVFRSTVATEFGPSLTRVPGISRSLATVLIEWGLIGLLVVVGPLFVLSMGYLGVRIVNPPPALVVDAEGFTDDASLTNLGRIQWAAVDGIQLVEQLGVPQLRVTFTDPDGVLDRYGPVKGAYLRFNRRSITGDGAIPLHQLDTDVDEVVAAFEAHGNLTVER